MPQAVNIVLADALATPVNHTFVPNGLDPVTGIYTLTDYSVTNEIGAWRVTIQVVEPKAARPGESSNNRVRRVRVGLHEPILETLSNNAAGFLPAPTVAYICRTTTEYILPERGNLQNRKDLRKMNYNLQNNALVVDVIENLSKITG